MKLSTNQSPEKTLIKDQSKIYNKTLFIALAIFMMVAFVDRQSLAVDDTAIPAVESDKSISEMVAEIQSSPEDMKAAETMFNQNCTYCHGNKGSGGKSRKMQCLTLLNDEYVFKTIKEGKKAGANIMPSWKRSFDDNQILTLTAYVMSLTTLPQCEKK
ncbi:MAG: mono/diheme cytochrome c family protein [Gammaproteobacteria bacterium]|jgi:mono/diheme cytochrome c family protein